MLCLKIRLEIGQVGQSSLIQDNKLLAIDKMKYHPTRLYVLHVFLTYKIFSLH